MCIYKCVSKSNADVYEVLSANFLHLAAMFFTSMTTKVFFIWQTYLPFLLINVNNI